VDYPQPFVAGLGRKWGGFLLILVA